MITCNQERFLKKIENNSNHHEMTEDYLKKKKRKKEKEKKIEHISEKFFQFQKMKAILISITSVIEGTLPG